MRLIEAYSCSGYGGKTLGRQRQPLGVAELLQSLCGSCSELPQNAKKATATGAPNSFTEPRSLNSGQTPRRLA
jgi:hypothetical protein